MNLKSSLTYSISFIALALLFLLSAYALERYRVLEPAPEHVKESVEQHLEKEFTVFAEQIIELEQVVDSLKALRWNELQDFKYPVFIYQNNQLTHWNENRLTLPLRIIQFDAGVHFIRLPGGFHVFKKNRSEKFAGTDYLYFIPVKYIFPLQNKHLQNHFAPELKIPAYYSISTTQENGDINIFYENSLLFSLSGSPYDSEKSSLLVIIFYLLVISFVLAAIYYAGVTLSLKTNPWLAFLTFLVSIILFRVFVIESQFPQAFRNLEIFNPALYAASVLHNSLGDLLFNVILLFLVILFFYKYFQASYSQSKSYHWSVLILSFLSSALLLFWMTALFKSQVIDSSISLEIDNFFSLNVFSIIAILTANLLLLGFFLLVIKAIEFARAITDNLKYLIAFGGAFLTVVVVYALFSLPLTLTIFLCFWVTFLLLAFNHITKPGRKVDYLSDTLLFAGLMGFFSGAFYHFYTEEKTEDSIKFMARRLAIDRDPVTEFLFDDVEMRLAADPFVKNYFLNPQFPFRELSDRLQSIYFSGYFNKYEFRLFTINSRGELIDGTTDPDKFGEEAMGITGEAQLTTNDYLFFIPRPDGTYAYLSNVPILLQDKVIGSLIIELTPKVYRKNYLYPELLLEERKKPMEEFERYEYAVYVNKKLITRQGRYPYNFFIEREITLTPGEYIQAEFNERQHLIYLADENKLVVVSREKHNWMQPVTYFSYLFCFNLLCIILVRLFLYGWRYLTMNRELSAEQSMRLTFRGKIQVAMLSIIVFSFVIIGAVTFFHFSREYNESFLARLLEKEEEVQASINYHLASKMQNQANLRGITYNPLLNLTSIIFDLADIHAIDINIYGQDGKLLLTSQPGIFEKGLLSELMHPEAVRNILARNRSQFVQNEKIGELEFLSVYVPIRNTNGEVLGFLNLPYFEQEKNLNREISGFFVALVNVYVLLLIGGGLLAFFIGNSLTQSLTTVSQKLQKVKLGKTNEPIEWKSNDEIGALVAEYNKMIKELEKSAKLLTKSEREYAWREMAKQIAHEIKNPLTPMKLRIQHLQRAMHENHPNVDEMAQKVLHSLIEQIDTLSHIASEFSSFAKMPKATYEPLNIVSIAKSSLEIFNDNSDDVHLTVENGREDITVYADKQQLNRVFNNLIKNAVQSIPSEREGEVKVRIDKDESGTYCIVAVEDNGTGIPEHLKENVFVPNFTTKSSGMGLGLAMAKQIIENTNGDIWFESEEDKGTIFYIKLEIYKEGDVPEVNEE